MPLMYANGSPMIDMAFYSIDLWNSVFDSQPVSVYAQGLKIGKDRPEISHIVALAALESIWTGQTIQLVPPIT